MNLMQRAEAHRCHCRINVYSSHSGTRHSGYRQQHRMRPAIVRSGGLHYLPHINCFHRQLRTLPSTLHKPQASATQAHSHFDNSPTHAQCDAHRQTDRHSGHFIPFISLASPEDMFLFAQAQAGSPIEWLVLQGQSCQPHSHRNCSFQAVT